MARMLILTATILCTTAAVAADTATPVPPRPAHTFSIVARDPAQAIEPPERLSTCVSAFSCARTSS